MIGCKHKHDTLKKVKVGEKLVQPAEQPLSCTKINIPDICPSMVLAAKGLCTEVGCAVALCFTSLGCLRVGDDEMRHWITL